MIMVNVYAALQTVPQDQYEAACIDGASSWQSFLHITVPHIKVVVGLLLVLRTIRVFNNFDIIYMTTAGGPAGMTTTMPLYIYDLGWTNKLEAFIRIVLPLASPGIVATAIYVFINAWNEYLYAMILMSSSDKTTISVAVKTLEGGDILNWGSLMAACAIVVVPSILFFCFIQNKMAGGPSEGAVK